MVLRARGNQGIFFLTWTNRFKRPRRNMQYGTWSELLQGLDGPQRRIWHM